MRVAYYALHYGKEYLAWSIRSIQDAVDQIHVFYTDEPSYGHRSSRVCPDTEAELKEQAHRFAKIPIVWHRGRWTSEGAHRHAIYDHVTGAQQCLVVDADEIWLPGTAKAVLDAALELDVGYVGVPFVHFWRSFHWVCRDHWMPIRVLNFDSRLRPATEFIHDSRPVHHFGYAQSFALTEYKWSCHGHQDELRPNWLDRFRRWTPGDPGDVHPTTYNIWTPEPFDAALLLSVLHDHPNGQLELIS